jgi:hypothetical protein
LDQGSPAQVALYDRSGGFAGAETRDLQARHQAAIGTVDKGLLIVRVHEDVEGDFGGV